MDFDSFTSPLKKKWVYHFLISPQTRNIQKPEWYLNQTLKWIYENIDIIESKVTVSEKNVNLKHKFVLFMLELVMKRLQDDVKTVCQSSPPDEVVLVHTYNEVVQFTKVIKKLLGEQYQEIHDKHDLLSVFAEQEAFEKIIEVEWDYAQANLKEITSAAVRWDPLLDKEFVDPYKVPRCVDFFLMLVKSLTERVECFRQLDCQFKLIELQCSLFYKFLQFIQKSTSSGTPQASLNILSDMLLLSDQSTIDLTRLSRVLNGVNFLRLVLKELSFIPSTLVDELDPILLDETKKLATEYKQYFDILVERVVRSYEEVDCDLKEFLEFIKPKLSHHIYEIAQDEVLRIYHERQTQNLLGDLAF